MITVAPAGPFQQDMVVSTRNPPILKLGASNGSIVTMGVVNPAQ